jgi:hypothetical protein
LFVIIFQTDKSTFRKDTRMLAEDRLVISADLRGRMFLTMPPSGLLTQQSQYHPDDGVHINQMKRGKDMMHRRLAGLVLAVVTIFAAGCGGSGTKSSPSANGSSGAEQQPASTSTTGTTTPASTSSPFIAETNVICARLNTQFTNTRYKTLQDLAHRAPALAENERTALSELRKLSPPANIAKDWNAMLTDLQAMASGTDAVARYAAHNDPASVARLNQYLINIQRNGTTIAVRHNLTSCSVV